MKFSTTTIHKVNYDDFDKAINEFLKEKGAEKRDYEIVADEEFGNDCEKAFDVGKYDWAIPTDEEKESILSGKLAWSTGKILEWMCQEGKIPSGEYLVEISW